MTPTVPVIPVIPPELISLVLLAVAGVATVPLTQFFKWLGERVVFFPALSGNAAFAANLFLNSLVVGFLPLLAGTYGPLDILAYGKALLAVIVAAIFSKGFYELLFVASIQASGPGGNGTGPTQLVAANIEALPYVSADQIADAVIAKLNASNQGQ